MLRPRLVAFCTLLLTLAVGARCATDGGGSVGGGNGNPGGGSVGGAGTAGSTASPAAGGSPGGGGQAGGSVGGAVGGGVGGAVAPGGSGGGRSSGGAGGSAGVGSTGGSAGGGGAPGTAGSGAGGSPLSFECLAPPPAVDAPPAQWVDATGNLTSVPSECGNLGMVSGNPCSKMVIAGVAKAGLYATEDGGKNWSKLGAGAGSAVISNRTSAIVYDPKQPGTFWQSGIYGNGPYKTTDNGKTFTRLGTMSHNDSVSIDFSDPERKTLLAGAHEAPSKLFRSTDGGATWTDIGKGLPSSAGFCNSTVVLGANNLLVGCERAGIYRSTDGATWTLVGPMRGVLPQPLVASDGTIYWLGAGGGIHVSKDQGLTFTQAGDATVARSQAAPIKAGVELPDRRIVVMGRTHLQISADKGASWKPIGDPLPPSGSGYGGYNGLAYSAQTKTFFIWRWDCTNTVRPGAIMSAGFDYTKP